MKKPSIHQQFQETLDFLYTQLPMFQRVGNTAFKKDLTNILALCKAIDDPYKQFPSIHLAGTNGKGSTAHILAAILQANGKKVGMYTSPHYKDFRERIKINGQLVSKKYIVDFVDTHRRLFEEIQPSFFEITVAMAFDYFAKQKVDVAIIETGLGGRLDSTNIITPLLSIITNIGYDHQQFLGDTLPEIAAEKAGIIKASIPVVIGETHPETKSVFIEQAAKKKAPLLFADQLMNVTIKETTAHHTLFHIASKKESTFPSSLKVNLTGNYQAKNLATALQAIAVIRENKLISNISDEAVIEGLANLKERTYFIGRWQQLGANPTILCDSGHNVDGLRTVFEQLKGIDYTQLHFVFGMVKDKDPSKVLSMLPTSAKYYFAKANIPRGLAAKELQKEAKKHHLKGRAYVSVKNALKAAKRQAKRTDLIFVGGSIFVVAEVL